MTTPEPTPSVVARTVKIVGWRPDTWRPVGGGYTPAARFVASSGARSVFVKAATTPLTARLLNREIDCYRSVSAPFVPRLHGYDADETEPLLIIEDLGAATWPPPWTDQRVERVLAQIAAMHATPTGLPLGRLLDGRDSGWPTVAENPEPFLALRLVTADWLEGALPALIEAEGNCRLDGDALTHLDLRSDNICIAADGVKFVDWAEARRSRATVDLGFFLPSLAWEGGPAPETILPDAPGIAATVAGFFAARAGLPDIPDAPKVRRVQREQLSTALLWAQRAVGLRPLA